MNNRYKTINKITWHDVSIKQYVEIQKLLQNDNLDHYSKMHDIILLIYGIDTDNLPMTEATVAINNVGLWLQDKVDTDKVEKYYKIGQYKCKATSLEDMTMAQFMDYQALTENSIDDKLADIISICLVPVGSKYNDGSYDLEELKDKINDLPITTGPALISFFQKRLNRSLIVSQICLIQQLMVNKNLTWKQKKLALKTVLKMGEVLSGISTML